MRDASPSLFAAFALAFALAACDAPTTSAPLCNGSAALCARPFDEVTLAGSHNAMSSVAAGFSVPNQNLGLVAQLELGVRALLIDTHATDDGVFLCHGTCTLGSIPLAAALADVVTFVEAHEGTVLALLVEDHTTVDELSAAVEESGLLPHLIEHDAAAPWPTLGAMVEAGTDVFLAVENGAPPPAWHHALFSHMSDTPFSFATLEDIDADASCATHRGSADNALFLVNHWVEDPFADEATARVANESARLLERATRCEVARGRTVNVLATDFVDQGALLDVVFQLNGRE